MAKLFKPSFLKAEWRKLAIANYAVPPHILEPYLPKYTHLDIWQGKCYVSLVGFYFVNTRLLGVPVPYHINFEEVNLRFYVTYPDKEGEKRGVVFIRELVPRAALSWVANTIYREHYQTTAMKHLWKQDEEHLKVRYSWWMQGKWQHLEAISQAQAQDIPVGSEEEFITEHYWGYSRASAEQTFEYEVRHPRWQHYPVQEYRIEVDFGATYGENFAFLNHLKPDSFILAEGSPISVETRKKL